MTDNDRANISDEQLILPVLPEQAPGISFEVKASGLIGLAASGQATPNDHKQIEDIRDVLLDALDDAIENCKGSNAFGQAAKIASMYRDALSANSLSIDKLYAFGIRLENFNTSISASIKTGDLPAKDIGVAEALDSVLALHGTSVLLTQRGQELVAKGNAYRRTKEEQIAYREKALELVQKIRAKPKFVESEAIDALEAADQDMATGRHPERSSEVAEAGNSNILGMISKVAIAMAAGGIAASVPGQIVAGEVTQLTNAAWFFLLEHKILLSEFARIGGQQLSYIQSVLNVITRFRKPEQFVEYLSGSTTTSSDDKMDKDAEEEAERLIIAGEPVPDDIAKRVRELNISGSKLETLKNLNNLVNLEFLLASFNAINDLSPLANLKKLKGLSVYLNQISDLTPIAGLTALQVLEASHNQISDLAPIAGLTALQSLDASHNQISDLAPVAGLTALRSLYASHNQISDLAPIAGLTALQRLDASHNQISDLAPMAGLTALQVLYASHNQISDLAPMAGLTALQSLEASDNQISDLAPIAGLTALQGLDANHNQISDLAPIAGLTALQDLDARHNQISDLAPIAGLTALRRLYASHNQISDLAPIAGLTALRMLDISGTAVLDIAVLEHLEKLVYLGVAHLEQGIKAFPNWPTSLKGVCLKGTPWPESPALGLVKTAIFSNGALVGERDEEFESVFFEYLPKDMQDEL